MDGVKKYNLVNFYILLIGIIILAIGLLSFINFNTALFINKGFIAFVFTTLVFILLIILAIAIKGCSNEMKANRTFDVMLVVLAILIFVLVLMKSIVVDFFQPLSLSTLSTVLLIIGFVIIFVGLIINAILCVKGIHSMPFMHIFTVVLILVMGTGYIWSIATSWAEFYNIEGSPVNVFVNGESDYHTFRIPSLIAIDKAEVQIQTGQELSEDLLIVFAEGRVNSSHDVGNIDIVMKLSVDGGNTWSPLVVLLNYDASDYDSIKVGNPTVVYDYDTHLLTIMHIIHSFRNGEGIVTNSVLEANITYDSMIEEFKLCAHDLYSMVAYDEETEEMIMRQSFSRSYICGPGKGIQIEGGIYDGRLVMPINGEGYSYVCYSDDHGISWNRSEYAASGNECEVAQLSDGKLVMVSREQRSCSGVHSEQYQRLFYSEDGGQTWSKEFTTSLKTPICMSSIDVMNDGTLLMTYPNDFLTRADLSIAYSSDNGETWNSKLLYDGPAGYSNVFASSDDNYAYVITEAGKINYNEALVFVKIDLTTLS